MGSVSDMDINKTLVVRKLSIYNKSHNIRIIIWNAQVWKTGVFVGIGETNYPCWTCTVATRVMDIPFVLTVLTNFKNGGGGGVILETWK